MIYWAQLFHFYQPPTQLPSVLEKICKESYGPLLRVLAQFPDVRVTVNINGVLTEMLRDYGHGKIVDSLRTLAEKGQIELTGSGKYHPILPLIPADEVKRQIDLNRAANSQLFGGAYRPAGFFPPEMAYGPEILPAITASGHRWLVLSGIACPIEWPVAAVPRLKYAGGEMSVLFRDDILSNKISFKTVGPKEFLDHLKDLQQRAPDIYVVTAMDAETYGHHIKCWEDLFLARLYSELDAGRSALPVISQRTPLAEQQATILKGAETARRVRTVTISQLLEQFPAGQAVVPRPSSWSTSREDLQAGNPYPLWADKNNAIHRLLWEHLQLAAQMERAAHKLAESDESKRFADIARGLLDRAFHSDQFWWASRRPMWDINLVHMGLIEQWRVMVNAYRSISASSAAPKAMTEWRYRLVAARDLRNKIEDQLFIA